MSTRSQISRFPVATSIPIPSSPPSGIEKAYADLNTADAVDCGKASVWTKQRAPADACAVAAFKAKKPFRLRYNADTRDENISIWVVGTRKGAVYFSKRVINAYNVETPYTDEYCCKKPIVVRVNGKRRLACQEKRNLTP